ncbi:hypothetical protein Taro_003207 [Colocasia esculenta]|uniref:Uncharacterized protein n=1 Tax=Colocasia esculenta TaxID=4460 RepID=A0A843TN44_COLES|nr:hypothetical protein [Colocasia esculenta]
MTYKFCSGRALVSTLLGLVSTHCPKTAQKGTSVDTTWASVDTLSQNSPESVLGSSLVSTLPDLVSTHYPSLTQKAEEQPSSVESQQQQDKQTTEQQAQLAMEAPHLKD